MKPIDPHNLDEWMFEYLEGNLGADDELVLEEHLASHPDSKVEFEAWKATYLAPATLAYPDQQQLLKPAFPAWGWGVGAFLLLLLGGVGFGLWAGNQPEALPPQPDATVQTEQIVQPDENPTVEAQPTPLFEEESAGLPEAPAVPMNETSVAEWQSVPQEDVATTAATSPVSTTPATSPMASTTVPPLIQPEDREEEPATENEPTLDSEPITSPVEASLPSIDTDTQETAAIVMDQVDTVANTSPKKVYPPTVKVAGNGNRRRAGKRNRKRKPKKQPSRLKLLPIDGDAF